MIRRDAGSDFLLITQHDHALLAGELGRRVGNELFRPPLPAGEVIEAIAQHDSGWPLHDDRPTLNKRGLPLHVFEAPVEVTVAVWSASVDRAAALGAYQGLLVSLHVLHLSAYAQNHQTPGSWSRQEQFEMNKFQHRQIEIQEGLRARVGLSNEAPRHLGLAQAGTSAEDDRLAFNFRLLTAMDRISLSLCCGENLFGVMEDVHPAPGREPVRIEVEMPDDSTMRLSPWPFGREAIALEAPARRVGRGPYGSAEEFGRAYSSAAVERVRLAVIPA